MHAGELEKVNKMLGIQVKELQDKVREVETSKDDEKQHSEGLKTKLDNIRRSYDDALAKIASLKA